MKKLRKCDDGERGTWKVPEAAAYAGCGERSIRKGIDAGIIPHLRFGRNIVIPKQAFLRCLDSAGEATR
jgi:excisionase family DNA binding protein